MRYQREIAPSTGSENQRSIRRTNKSLFVIVIATLPFSTCRIYVALTENISKDTVRLAQVNLASKTLDEVTYFTHSTMFHLYTLSGTLFP